MTTTVNGKRLMKILTLDEVVAIEKGKVISGLTGKLKHVWPAAQDRNDATRIKQTVILKDGSNEIWLSIDDPETHGGEITTEMVGQKVYAWAGLTPKRAQASGLVRGGDIPSTSRPGELRHYVNLQGAAEWGVRDSSVDPGKAKEKPPEDDDIPMSFDEEKPKAEKPAEALGSFDLESPFESSASPVTPVTEKEEPKKEEPTISVSGPVTFTPAVINSEKALALLTLQHRKCLEAAIDTVKAMEKEIGLATGETSSTEALIAMANALFAEANRRKIW